MLIWLGCAARAATLEVPDDYPDLGAAVLAAEPGDTVRIGPGVFPGDAVIDFDLTVVGAGQDLTELVIDAFASNTVTSGAAVTFSDLALTGPDQGNSFLYVVDGGATLAVTDVTIRDVAQYRYGLSIDHANLVATGLTVEGVYGTIGVGSGTASFVGGAFVGVGGPIAAYDSDLLVSGVAFVDTFGAVETWSNAVPASTVVEDCTFDGGTLGISGPDLTVRRSRFSDADAPWYGGVIYGSRTLIVEDSTFDNITGTVSMITNWDSHGTVIARNTFTNVTSTTEGIAVHPQAFYPPIPETDVVDNTFVDTTFSTLLYTTTPVTFRGNRLERVGSEYAGLLLNPIGGAARVSDNVFVDFEGPEGLALFLTGRGEFDHNLVIGTSAGPTTTFAAGLLMLTDYTGSLAVRQNTFAANFGDGMSLIGGSQFALTEQVVVNNLFVGYDGGFVIGADPDPFGYNLVWDAPDGAWALGPLPATHLTTDPWLAALRDGPSAALDLAPRAGSPVIDAGDPAILDADGTRSDIGYTGGPIRDPLLDVDVDGDGSSARFDCDDADPDRFPAALEDCGGIDRDCDGDPNTGVVYPDIDGDGLGDATAATTGDICTVPAGHVRDGQDCDDGDPSTGLPSAGWTDLDGDGHGTPVPAVGCPATGVAPIDDDCDDTVASTFPGAPEVCDALDNDCDGTPDDGLVAVSYRDADGDGFGTPSDVVEGCEPVDGYVATGDDCDDRDAAISPAATEVCDLDDNDCDAEVDEGTLLVFYRDADDDGFGVPSDTSEGCKPADGYAADVGDCDDTDPTRWDDCTPDTGTPPTTEPEPEPDTAAGPDDPPADLPGDEESGGCGCETSGRVPLGFLWVFGLGAVRRRRLPKRTR